MDDMYVCALLRDGRALRDGAPVPHGNSGTARELRYRPGWAAHLRCGGVRLSARLSILTPPRPAIHLQDGKGDPTHLPFMVYVHELTTCALTAVDRQGSYFFVHAILLCLLDLS